MYNDKGLFKVGPGVRPELKRAPDFQKYLGPRRHSPKEGYFKRKEVNLTPP